MNTIILAAGKIDYTRLPFGMHQSNATIPVNGKPVIGWILDDLIQKKFTTVSVVLREENNRLKQLLTNHYKDRIDIDIVSLINPISIIDSLHAGLSRITHTQMPIQVILGDTLIYDSFQNTDDTLFVSEVPNSANWCIVKSGSSGELEGLIDKKELPGKSHLALCGYYCFSDFMFLKTSVEEARMQRCNELSSVLLSYHKHKPLALRKAHEWFDFGHLETFIHSRKSLLRPRHFNSLTINPLLNTIEKKSLKDEKLLDELNWFKLLPESLKALTPRIFYSDNETKDHITIIQEFYGYPTLSELYVYGDLSETVWRSIIEYLFQILQLFKNYQGPELKNAAYTIYVTKTKERIESLLAQDSFWRELWASEDIKINEKSYGSVEQILQKLFPRIEALCKNASYSLIHGDFCLSNILYDLNNQIVRLIDPRGSFGEKGIYGDARYDVAKLRHSITGEYDYIVGDLFQISFQKDEFRYSMYKDEKDDGLKRALDSFIHINGFCLDEIKLIEGLLFLSMIPYHVDHFSRQQMMFVRAIEILSELKVSKQ